MGIFGDLAKGIASKTEEIKQIKEKLDRKSSEELFEIIDDDGFFGSSTIEKSVARKILKDRGDIV